MKESENMKKIMSMVLSLVMVGTMFGCSADKKNGGSSESSVTESTASAKVTIEGTKFMVDGKELWINGVNTPWQKWNDFRSGAMDEEFWDTEFARLAADGVNCTRIWVNCNGQSIVRLADDGRPMNINEGHWEALDKLFELAEKHKVYIMPTLCCLSITSKSLLKAARNSRLWLNQTSTATVMRRSM